MTAKCYGGDPTASSGQAYRARRSGWKSRREQGADAGVTARDNVLLEFGLFAGALERRRVVVLQKHKVGLPTDMQGLTVLRYENNDELDDAIQQIADRVDKLGPMQRLTRRQNC